MNSHWCPGRKGPTQCYVRDTTAVKCDTADDDLLARFRFADELGGRAGVLGIADRGGEFQIWFRFSNCQVAKA